VARSHDSGKNSAKACSASANGEIASSGKKGARSVGRVVGDFDQRYSTGARRVIIKRHSLWNVEAGAESIVIFAMGDEFGYVWSDGAAARRAGY
jgi:hypothetical protein